MHVERLTDRIIYSEGKIRSPKEKPTWMDEDSGCKDTFKKIHSEIERGINSIM